MYKRGLHHLLACCLSLCLYLPMLLVVLLSGVSTLVLPRACTERQKGRISLLPFRDTKPTLPEHVFQTSVLPCLAYTYLHTSCVGASAWTYLAWKVTNTFPAFIYTVPVDITLNNHFYTTCTKCSQNSLLSYVMHLVEPKREQPTQSWKLTWREHWSRDSP
ncbi:hypothetical protein B0T24DRAFT_636809 [Lasiosphaeria ovina]|uniref:Uncharacterized protein n=1 Tax=Lasiosphaeria ovina TaxID=92902 RepID=A0AAE0N0L8_9PEZI|nr:hypothetical protein B0T24DRAFT_636809 [Lasiosphaeria ovina]